MKLKPSLLMTVVLAFMLIVCIILICTSFSITVSISRQQHVQDGKTFYQIALWSKTDKVTSHRYQCIYDEALMPFRYRPNTKILEIGLGCGMAYGPGSSYKLWNSYFLDAKIYIFELDKTCGEMWYSGLPNETDEERKRLPVIIYGDQMNRTALQEMVKAHGGWDIIVDDGGHYMQQQVKTFEELWLAVLPNGYYFIEDLASSRSIYEGGTPDGLSHGERETAITMISRMFASSIRNLGFGKRLKEVVCCDQICGLSTLSKYT